MIDRPNFEGENNLDSAQRYYWDANADLLAYNEVIDFEHDWYEKDLSLYTHNEPTSQTQDSRDAAGLQ